MHSTFGSYGWVSCLIFNDDGRGYPCSLPHMLVDVIWTNELRWLMVLPEGKDGTECRGVDCLAVGAEIVHLGSRL